MIGALIPIGAAEFIHEFIWESKSFTGSNFGRNPDSKSLGSSPKNLNIKLMVRHARPSVGV